MQKKVICKEPGTFKEALRIARQKYQSLMFKIYHEEVRPSREDYHRHQAPQVSVSTCVSLNNSTSTEQDDQDIQSAVPITLPMEEEPFKRDILEETLSVRYQISEEQEKAIHKNGKDSIPQASASHHHRSKLVSLRKSRRRSWFKSKASKSSQVSLEQSQGEIDFSSSSTLANYE